MRPTLRVPIAATVLGVAILCASVGAPSPASAAPPGVDPRVFVIGDSVILGAHDAVLARLAGWQVTFIAKESFFTWQAPAAIAAYRPTVGDITIVALGNNDGEDPGLFAHEIDQVMAALGPARKVLWVNLRQFRPWVPAANAQLVAATTRYPNLGIVDWDGRATPDPSLVYADGLHLNPAGQAAMAALAGDAVDAAAAQLTAPPTTVAPVTTTAPATTTTTRVRVRVKGVTATRPPAAVRHSVLAALQPLHTPTARVEVGRLAQVVESQPHGGGHDSGPDLAYLAIAVVLLVDAAALFRRRRVSPRG